MDSEFMEVIAQQLAEIGLEVVRFEFPYMIKRREDGKKRPPDRMPVLLSHLQQLISESKKEGTPLYIAGKSMGGRVATMLLESEDVDACFVFGYPFHPVGKPNKLRTEHLENLSKPLHIFQGTRDTMGSFNEVSEYNLSPSVHLHWLEDGNHDLKPRKVSGYSQQDHIDHAVKTIKEWIS
ncbi:MAG: alpha/beta hydrolase [Neptuniibacter sp.]|nr:alpha/beta hydrolase [Neptuniibacter sp.]